MKPRVLLAVLLLATATACSSDLTLPDAPALHGITDVAPPQHDGDGDSGGAMGSGN